MLERSFEGGWNNMRLDSHRSAALIQLAFLIILFKGFTRARRMSFMSLKKGLLDNVIINITL